MKKERPPSTANLTDGNHKWPGERPEGFWMDADGIVHAVPEERVGWPEQVPDRFTEDVVGLKLEGYMSDDGEMHETYADYLAAQERLAQEEQGEDDATA